MQPVKLTSEEIKKLVFSLKSLDQEQRELVRDVLDRLAHSADGKISEEELRRELSKLKATYKLSDIDAKAVFKAVFAA